MSEKDERLEEFRKRLRGPEQNKETLKSWIGSPVAWLALALSLWTAFYTFVYHSDELSVVFDNVLIVRSPDPLKFMVVRVKLPKAITFVNSGSRPITATKFGILIAQSTSLDTKRPDCNSPGTTFEYDLEPIVVKPYESAAKNVKLIGKEPENYVQDLFRNATRDEQDDSYFIACGKFTFVTLDAAIWNRVIKLDLFRMSSKDIIAAPNRLDNFVIPQTLIKRNRFWTSVAGGEQRDPLLKIFDSQ